MEQGPALLGSLLKLSKRKTKKGFCRTLMAGVM